MSLKYVVFFILLVLLTGIDTVTGQTENIISSGTPILTSLPSLTPVTDKTSAPEDSPASSETSNVSSVPSLTPITDKTSVPEVSPASPEASNIPSLTPVTDKTSAPEGSPASPGASNIPSLTPVTDKTSVPEGSPASSETRNIPSVPSITPVTDKTSVPEGSPAAVIHDANSLPSVTPVPTPDVKITVYKKKNIPVIFYEEELFSVNTAMGPYSPEERVSIILNRLQKISDDRSFNPEEIKVEIKDGHPCIIYKDIVIMTLSQEDGKHEGLSDREVADKYAQKIRNMLKSYKEERSFKTIMYGIIYSLITTLIFALLLMILDRLLALIYKKINSWQGSRISDIKIQKLVLLSGDKIAGFIVKSVKIIAFTVKFIICYIYLSLVFSFFVWTKDVGTKLFSYVLSGIYIIWIKLLSYLPHLFFIIFVAFVTYYIIRFVRFVFVELEKGTVEFPGFYREWAQPTYMIVRFLIIALSLIIIFPYLPGYDSPAFKGISLFLGVLFSLGSTAVVSNMVAGIILIYMNAFKIGDRVKIGDVTGDIIEKTLLLTRIRTIKNVDITMPNAMILGSHITNYSTASQEPGLILHTTVTIGYDVPWKDVHKLLIDAALMTEDILKEPVPFVLQTSLDDFYVSYQLNAYTNKPNSMARIYSEIHQNIQDKFNEGGVEIMSPHYRAMRDGNQTTIPAGYLPENYSSPAFKIFREEKP